jgi:NTE family protein
LTNPSFGEALGLFHHVLEDLYLQDSFGDDPLALRKHLFEPFEVDGIPGAGQESEAWKDRLWHKGKVPEKAMFVDGGMVSNFPIEIFHREDGGTPRKPTFGARLTSFRENLEPVKDLSYYTGALLHTMRHDFDVQYLQEHKELQHLICNIDAGEVANWLNFYMGEEQKKKLFKGGAERSLKFLEEFDWEKYKEVRKKEEQNST